MKVYWGNFFQVALFAVFLAPAILSGSGIEKKVTDLINDCQEIILFDGSNNRYLLRQKFAEATFEFEYRPIEPAQSSSLVYDGGTPIKKEISPLTFKKIFELAQQLLQKKELHKQNREMGTCLLKMNFVSKEEKVILSRNKHIENFLNELKLLLGCQH